MGRLASGDRSGGREERGRDRERERYREKREEREREREVGGVLLSKETGYCLSCVQA